jgi:hypothetical protein
MTQQSTKKEYNTFVKGIVTEAGPLTFPENASLSDENCVLNRDGSRQRRLGMDFESGFVLQEATVLEDDAVASFRWFNAANNVDNQFALVQAGTDLFIFDATATSISGTLLDTIDLSTYITGKVALDPATISGYLVVAEGTHKPFYISYDEGTGNFTLADITIKIRDFFGVDDGHEVDEQPAALSVAHHYNLLNQGWSTANINAYHAAQGVYPSNAQQWFLGKNAEDVFTPAQLAAQDFGTTPAPQGRMIIDAFARSTSRNALSGLTTAADIELNYPTAVASAFQRVFYAGVASTGSANEHRPNYTGYVFFSRVIRSPKDFGQAHSDADPTSEVDSELVDTDGGYVNIPDSGKIYKLVPKGTGMLVFAEKGIWEITSDEGGFRATVIAVNKVTEFGIIGASSIVDAEDALLYWNRGGIYLLSPDPNSGRLAAQNMTETTIQTLFNEINQPAKRTAVGSYDPINRRVQWMYNDEEDYDGLTYRNKYTKELVYDVVLQAFYINSISEHGDPSPYIAGYLETPDFLLRQEGIRTRGESVTKYLVVRFTDIGTGEANVSFAYYRDPTFRDWKSIDAVGTSFSSFLVTGYEIMGDSARKKQSTYLTIHFKRTERFAVEVGAELVPDNPSGCIVQAQWDWADSPESNKWGTEFQAYRLLHPMVLTGDGEPIKYGFEVVTTKNRLPGSGKALSLYIRSDGDKDFYLNGWAINFTGSSSV